MRLTDSAKSRQPRATLYLIFILLVLVVCATLGLFLFPLDAQARNARGPAAPSVHMKVRPDVARFRSRVDAVLADAHAKRVFLGVLVTDRDTGQVFYDLNSDHFFLPASNAKVITTALALGTLGGGYQFRTTLESSSPIDDQGRLAANLVLVGRGDPDLSNRKFPYQLKTERDGPSEKILSEMVDAAAARGLKEVDGDIVADDSYFPYDPYPEGWGIGDMFFEYGAPVSAIDFNDNTITVTVSPGVHENDPAIVMVDPSAGSESIETQITTAPPGGNPYFAVVRQPGPNFLLLRGMIPLGHAPADLDLAMVSPGQTAALALKQLFEQRGIRVTGTARVAHAPAPETSDSNGVSPPPPPPAPSAAGPNPIVLAEHLSPPLIECIRLTNKISQNLHAEILLRTVAREKGGYGSADAGIKVEQDFLKAAGVQDGDVVLSDGSGLARDDLVTPRAMVALLHYVAQQPWGAEFLSTLPIAGVDGTLDTRLKQITGPAVVQAKTGSLEHVRAMSGYATTQGGEHLVFAIFGNNDTERGRDATSTIDAIVMAMIQTLGPAPARKARPVHSAKQ